MNPEEFKNAIKKLSSVHQEHILEHWDQLNDQEKNALLHEIAHLDLDTLKQQLLLLNNSPNEEKHTLKPFIEYSHSGNSADRKKGLQIIASGQVGCLLIAGGQGTRLGCSGPKGLVPITPIKHKPLFQLFSEKVLAASKQAGKPLLLAIMTSPLNHDETVSFFRAHHFFGLQSEQVSFFSQDTLPFLDDDKKLFLKNSSTIAEGPDGNGLSLKHFVESGVWKKWKQAGVKYLNFILIDNPLADPFDAELVGFHARQNAEVTIKCTEKLHEQEKMGVLVKDNEKIRVIEYSEFPENERTARDGDQLKHRCANLSLFCFDMEFVARAENIKLPLHKALKSAAKLTEKIMAWKFETFIFDLLADAKRIAALMYPREGCYAPLKNATGEHSLPEVQKALQLEAKRVFADVTGHSAPDHPFELSQQFYYPTQQLLAKWKDKPLPNTDYIKD